MKTAVVYYSLTGNSAYLAKKAAELTGGCLIRLLPENDIPKKGFGRFIKGGSAAIRKMPVKLIPYEFDESNYDSVIICFPVWASNCPPAIGAFLKDHSLKDQRVYLLSSSMSGQSDDVAEKLRGLLGDTPLIAAEGFWSPLKKPEEAEAKLILFLRRQALMNER